MKEISEESYLELKQILEEKDLRSYSMEEVREIGNGLIEFYSLLSELNEEDDEVPDEEF